MQTPLHAPRPATVPGGNHPPAQAFTRPRSLRSPRALSLLEIMFAMSIMVTVMMAFIGTFIQSRRVTESNVLHAAATSMVYGIIEQIKQLDYTTQLPSNETDPFVPAAQVSAGKTPPYFRVRLNQSTVVWLKVPTSGSGPTTTPAPTATAADVGAVDNFTGNIPLSTVTGTASQQINLNLWVWIDQIPSGDASEVKKVTVVYTYSYFDGRRERTVRDREVIIRTRFDQ